MFSSYRSAPLSEFVEDFWHYEGYVAPRARELILPSGTFELVLNLRANELRIYDPRHLERFRRFSGAIVSGPYAGCFASDAAQEVAVMGVHFKPGGAFPFLPLPAEELVDTHVDLSELWGKEAEALRERLLGSNPQERFHVLEAMLTRRMTADTRRHRAVIGALRAFGSCGRSPVARLAANIGVSERRLLDVFRSEVGLTPKMFGRISRFQGALTALHPSDAADWAQLACVCGYFDQSHLIRDFLEFSGLSPEQYQRQRLRLQRAGAQLKRNHLPVHP
ncbi:MAG TPA: helix-turn-helix domain-containing protein [Steroidobacteraceae bacterium]|nr:helix-turn-helix domain-containing protein [Steroidobacteraceae bacterium]